jgi:hypothetical protein
MAMVVATVAAAVADVETTSGSRDRLETCRVVVLWTTGCSLCPADATHRIQVQNGGVEKG